MNSCVDAPLDAVKCFSSTLFCLSLLWSNHTFGLSSVLTHLDFQDYTGKNVTVDNFFAALLGDKDAIKGGSRKVINSGPDDHIFIYYSDHGGPGVLGA